MKRAKFFLFPLLFVIALAGSAFTSQTNSSAASPITAYYYDNNWGTCDVYVVNDDNCVMDDLGYLCSEYVPNYGWAIMLQYDFGNTCYQPYYSYYSND